MYKLSEEMRRELTLQLNAQGKIHNDLKAKCRRLESDRVVAGGVHLVGESTAHLSLSTVGLRIIRYQNTTRHVVIGKVSSRHGCGTSVFRCLRVTVFNFEQFLRTFFAFHQCKNKESIFLRYG